mmetsp:Transcript_10743/g.25353  ORF Transcript_10743/g.25353 Transcript_10743/m.25353 type:complete len:397 (-) Transcript_10743:428-1618(-)
MIFHLVEFLCVVPVQLQCPGPISKVVADEINISGVNEGRDTTVEHVCDVRAKVVHPIAVELHVDAHVARFPPAGLVADVKGLARRVEVHERVDVAKVVAEGRSFALLANVVRVEAGHLVRGRFGGVAHDEGALARKGVDDTIALVAFVDELLAGGDGRGHRVVRILGDGLDPVRILVGHLGIPLVLLGRIGKTIADGNTTEIDFDETIGNILVLLEHLVGDRWSIVATIGFAHNEQRIRGIFGMLLVEGLEEVVRIFRHHLFVLVRGFAVRVSDARRLVEPKHVPGLRPAALSNNGGLTTLIDRTGPILGQQSQRAAAARPTSQPDDQRDAGFVLLARQGVRASLLEEPEEQMLVLAVLVVLGSLDIHVSREGQRRGGVAKVGIDGSIGHLEAKPW